MFSVFFLSLSFLFGYLAIHDSLFYVWPALNSSYFGTAYVFNAPKLFLKSKAGKIPLPVILVNLPWLLFQNIIWNIERLVSNENPYDRIDGTNITIGRRLQTDEYPNDIDVVVDLTCEFTEPKLDSSAYINLACLDGVALNSSTRKEIRALLPIIENKNIYIHCAQGHGRTAMVAIEILILTNVCRSFDEAQQMVLRSRPKAKMSKRQYFHP